MTPLAPFLRLTPLLAPLKESPTTEAEAGTNDTAAASCVAAKSVVILRPGVSDSSAALGFEPWVRWQEYATQVLRDEILLATTAERPAPTDLRIHRTPKDRGYTLPCYVGEPPAPVAPEPLTARRRRR